jgi:hypothetical protein
VDVINIYGELGSRNKEKEKRGTKSPVTAEQV